MKYIVVSGGVVSGLGKGITSSSIGMLLRSSGMRVTMVKIDPYLVSPIQHPFWRQSGVCGDLNSAGCCFLGLFL